VSISAYPGLSGSQSAITEPPEVSIIVVSYGTRDMTLACLDSIVRETVGLSYEVIVVDNASTDGSAEAIATRFPDFRLLAETENLGFAAANNFAARHANGKYILLLNPDTIVLDHAVERLVAFAKRRPQAGIWGGRTLFGDRSLNATSCWAKLSFWNLFCSGVGLAMVFPNSPVFNSGSYGGWNRDTEREVDVVTGCLLLIERVLWDRLGGFDKDFFMYGEDADLCLRAAALGLRPAITPDATIVHYGGATEQDSARKIKRVLAAKARLIGKFFPKGTQGAALALLSLKPAIKSVMSSANDKKMWREVWADRVLWQAGKFAG
jgi:GT2 family glycosyltransferase